MKIRTVALGNQCALHQGSSGDFITAFANLANTLAIIGLRYTRCYPKACSQFAGFSKVFDVPDRANNDHSRKWLDTLDTDQIVITI